MAIGNLGIGGINMSVLDQEAMDQSAAVQAGTESTKSSMRFEHGGDLVQASAHFSIALEHWLDLSTGLSPYSYPAQGIPAWAFEHLPYLQPQFIKASATYYGAEQGIPCIGSQMLIQTLPYCVANYPVLLPDIGYNEHRKSWAKAGFDLSFYPALDAEKMQSSIDQTLLENPRQHLVIINPNNPTGVLIEPAQLITWAKQLDSGCYLVIDEAFIDLWPQYSVLSRCWPDNILVLRSFGKFFGLAGIRIGFAFCQGLLKAKLIDKLGLWMINGPAQYLAAKAMLDERWQHDARKKIHSAAKGMQQQFHVLLDFIYESLNIEQPWFSHQPLFSSYKMPQSIAYKIQYHFAQAGILLRVIELAKQPELKQRVNKEPEAILRIGVIASENSAALMRIDQCIKGFLQQDIELES
ncbi:aminotransferase class I/II-fold pyridoxal phosphate-dependent enzyme [Gammaproteobacteria bacterium AS21]